MSKGKTVLLYSGGMDSWLIDKLIQPDVKLYVDVNSRYSSYEIARLPKDVLVERLDLSRYERSDAIIPLRNLYFVMVATNYGDIIHLGATAGDRVLDKSFGFAERTSGLLSYLWQPQHWTEGRSITVSLPYKNYTKSNLLSLYRHQGGDMEKAFKESFSCYHPEYGEECWNCKPCYRKFVAFGVNDYLFPRRVIKKMEKFIKDNQERLLSELEERGSDEKEEALYVFEKYGLFLKG